MRLKVHFICWLLILPALSFSQDWSQKFAHITQLIQAQNWELALKDNSLLLTELEKEFGNTHLYYVMGLNNAANIYRSTEQYDLAIEIYKQSHEIARLHFAADAPEMEFYDRSLAFLYFDTQKLTPAIEHYENLLNILKEPHPENDYWNYYIELAECYSQVRNNELTIRFFETLEKNHENPQIRQRLSLGRIWTLLGNAHKFLTQYEASEAYLTKAYDDCLAQGNLPACVIPMENLGDLFMLTEEYDRAKKYYGQAWDLQKDKSEYDQYFVRVTENLITANMETAQEEEVRKFSSFLWNYLSRYRPNELHLSFQKGRDYFQRKENHDLYEFALLSQLDYLKEQSQQGLPVYQATLNKLGYFYQDQGKTVLSEDYLRQAVDNLRKTKGETHRELLPVLDRLIVVLGNNNKAADAQNYDALRHQVRQANPGADPMNVNVTKLTRASSLQQQGALDEALQLILEIEPFYTNHKQEELGAYLTFLLIKSNIYIALDQFEVAAPWLLEGYLLSEDNPEYVLQNVNFISKIGQYYEVAGDFENMVSFMNGAIHILRKYPQKKGILEPFYVRLARAYTKTGEWTPARQMLTSTIPVLIEVYGEHSMHVLSAKNDLADLFTRTGETENAVGQYLDMLTASADHLSAQSKQTIYFNLANCYIRLGDQEQAIFNFNRYIDFYLEEINTVFTFLSEDQKNKYIESTQNSYHYILNFYHSLDDWGPVLEDIYRLQNAFKGMVLQSSVDIKQRWKSLEDPQAMALFEEWQQARQAQNILQFEDNEEELRLITQKLDGLEREMSRMIPDYASQKLLNEGSWKDLQVKLGDDEAVIEFIQFEIGDVWDGWANDQQYAALIIAKGQSIMQYIPLFKQSELDVLLQHNQHQENPNSLYRGAVVVNRSAKNANYGRQLYDILWQPLEEYLHGKSTVYYIPSGAIHQLAVAAIPAGDNQVLMEKYRLVQRNNLGQIVNEKEAMPLRHYDFVLFGGIDYDARINRGSNSSNRTRAGWSYLAGTLDEIQKLETILAGNNTRLYQGDQATEQAFYEVVRDNKPKVLHIATHGYFFSKPERDLNQTDESALSRVENPLLRSGLILAGGNHAWTGDEPGSIHNDGILSASEISNLDLENTDLVVLSACETGLGDINGNEGVFGLQRAFRTAGAKYLLMSLWKVPDAETSEFMQTFYAQWQSTENIEEAFHATQKTMKAKYPNDPYSWAAFVLVR